MSSEVMYALDQANEIVAFMNRYPSTFRSGDENNGQALMFMFALFKCQETARLRNENSEILLRDVVRFMVRHLLFFETRGLIVEIDGRYQIKSGKPIVFYKNV